MCSIKISAVIFVVVQWLPIRMWFREILFRSFWRIFFLHKFVIKDNLTLVSLFLGWQSLDPNLHFVIPDKKSEENLFVSFFNF